VQVLPEPTTWFQRGLGTDEFPTTSLSASLGEGQGGGHIGSAPRRALSLLSDPLQSADWLRVFNFPSTRSGAGVWERLWTESTLLHSRMPPPQPDTPGVLDHPLPLPLA
jgi:hypothetical protein